MSSEESATDIATSPKEPFDLEKYFSDLTESEKSEKSDKEEIGNGEKV